MKFFRHSMIALLGLGLAACVAAAGIARYQGILHLKGNAPFIQPVLVEKNGRQWLLTGIAPETAIKLQNQQVEVEATRAPDQPGQLQKLNVNKISAIHRPAHP